ncbi:A disintegrin and metalloproteinase with thrombospondin motifs 9 isoform X1 [Sphaeramia orbicularis]|uniref:A disintegrin and metalloproteinase with thrombospondin motifs 9 isoform X1 n=2 Tax=Sphaeramia orbicularis TaxID=375764 RepID=UPI001180CAD7|nr:A disintegrin and metalloproteinase with thrombospondin motifs 9 isoform X1 [Sphaeramia orbicularis]
MHVLFWGLGFLLFPDLLNVAASTGRLLLNSTTVKEETGAYEIVTPVRVNEAGDKFPTSVHFKRKRRSLEENTGNTTDHWASPNIHYRISAFGQNFHLNLTLDSGFIAPLYTVTVLGVPRGDNITDFATDGEEEEEEEKEEEEEDTELRHCFYKGHVNAQAEHAAVISLCSGLLGTFRSPEGEYFVEPLHSYQGEHYEEEHTKPHIVYRKSAPKKQSSGDNSACDTSGHKQRHKRHKLKRRPAAGVTAVSDAGPVVSAGIFSQLESLSAGLASDALLKSESSSVSARPSNDSSRDSGPHRRSKRFLSYPRFVEVMLVADSKMVEHHGSNLQHYILTLMSIVSSIYKDPSIGNLINIVIVKLVIINNEQDGPVISFNAQTTLKNFCIWQQSQNILDDNHHSHHDTAILITRQDICRARDKCDTLGLAELGTVCDPYRSCSISEDNGLSTAFTIAHELGHVFNMPHDDSNKCKEDGVKIQQHVMAPTLNYNTNPWMWSKCSRKYITEFLDTGYGECLLDEPVSRPYSLSQQLPGRIYNVNKQCELIFGPGTQVCPYMTQCRRLWCTSPEGAQRGCRTQHMPWADGTDCSPGKHCKHGLCIAKEHDATPVEGAWGVWSPFGTCSRTCGGGIKIAVRECNRPVPRNGGMYCVGRRMKFRSCNSEPCSKQKKDFREEQCAAFDGRHFNINGLPPNVRWVPKYSGILMKDRCKLFCRVAGSTAYYQLRDRVIDGTPCGPDTNDICVQGLCRQAGCDHVLNSKARRDKCGVCGGDNSSCKTVAGTFNIVRYGYNEVVRIPSGATNIDVRQHSYSGKPEDDNYLAVSNSRGEFLLNGEFVVSMFKREIKVGNAVIEYSGSDHVIERINCTDRIEEEIIVQVLSVGNLYNPDVRYSFNIPIEDKPQQFFWDAYGPWQECSRLCQGERKRKILCSRESDRVVVSDQRCHGTARPAVITETCNTECELRWYVARKSECTAQCGLGYRTLEIYCAKINRADGKTQKVDDRYCSNQHKPDDKEGCHGDCNPGGWEYSPWSECSKSCGGGTRRRGAVCRKAAEAGGDESKCSQRDKLAVQSCNEFLCPQWKTGDWSECLVTCGKGYKHRQIWCQFGEDRLDDHRCGSSKPESVQTCQQQECASWQVGPWGQCTTSCGPGYQMRAVKCVVGSYGAVMDDTECNAATRPTDTQDCELAQCPSSHPIPPGTKVPTHQGHKTQWRFGSWTQCSASCGKGTRMRYVSCRDNQGGVAEESACAHLPKPPAREVCSVVACGQWKVLEWTTCSVTCGQGKTTRQVLCVNFSDQEVNISECDPDDRPTTEQDCAMSQCPSRSSEPRSFPSSPNSSTRNNLPRSQSHQWRTGPWGACSSTCAGGFQRRVVVCQDENGYPANSCEDRSRPNEQRSCESGPCPQWIYGNWGECTKPCGGGIKTRLVVCQRPNGERFNDLSCEIHDKPPDREQCNTQPCPSSPHWSTDPWSSCSASCGRGFKYRKVSCVTGSGRPVPEENCQHLPPKPSKQRRCRGGRCPKWKTGNWEECSASCGDGVQRRDVFCQVGDRRSPLETGCPQRSRPASSQSCRVADCPSQYRWREGDWQPCSKSCGSGHRRRALQCVDQNQQEVHEMYCVNQIRPPDIESCNTQACEYIWITGEWTECSVSCGQGYRQRLISCSEVHVENDNYEYGHQSLSNCPGTPPESYMPCNLDLCPPPQEWRVGIWGPCSVSCGDGVMERTVQCVSAHGQETSRCSTDTIPEARKACRNPTCHLPSSCKEVQSTNGPQPDGEHLINIQGKALKVYCAGMQTETPQEYITLTTGEGENFSEIFGFRLNDPTQCPANGSNREDCDCRRDYNAAGITTFNKVRLDISKMNIITTDWQFAFTGEGKRVPFATAGDCYSASRCPQGQFRINLSGTGFKLTEDTSWITQGNYAVADIHKSQDGSRVSGICGGYCGKCSPSSGSNLPVTLE